jgi:hypothetical protein
VPIAKPGKVSANAITSAIKNNIKGIWG